MTPEIIVHDEIDFSISGSKNLRPCIVVWIEATSFDNVVAKIEHVDFLASMSEKNTFSAGVMRVRS